MSAPQQAAGEGRVTLTRQGGVATLTFDRPAARNAMTWAMYGQLAEHCRALAAEGAAGARVVVLRGAGGEAFVAGTDIAQFQQFSGGDDGVAYEARIDEGIALVEQLPMPTVAVIEGWAVGGGLAIATACDFRLATPKARFGVPIAKTLGNTLSALNLAKLRAAWGLQPVRRMLLLAQVLDADAALGCGFLEGVHAPEALEAEVAALCERLGALAPVTQAVIKESLRRQTVAAVADTDDLVRQCYGSDDFREGVDAFVGKRPAVWKGR
ncbi:enoyl-CoA hydratase/isomerase family protein [Cupriavidus taiwanensis]|uniref:enoyl-CoA hydratase/isomerase family protein n=1 Tax=Cupriavidus taiwanensis TaxID=164546 RepID=UPI000E103EFD|nr:enoyl-CoA hydratase/isomerase family protein [Cupriavidus taiwanensis]SOY50564.1 Putative enoyl-CoA hydratase/isomerase [Cupriavidus taiwanensis]SOY50838.1 Putative enoyl-CoA hydratase/isomerase [Cupriavidus taiwanensis]SOY83727.1 Putative enoyl-CoA hydratase/isomerase [Cupriavidus taiwanensis]SOZ57955.1 Putative enoyl-CoA hydratase/isomerase [Cupriavidus taiwanensis]SOZ79762.1 Putative enoyl-CoA hydratase/isomerase [Cupriavidus taiwanensis]